MFLLATTVSLAVLIFTVYLAHCVGLGWRTRTRLVGSVRTPAAGFLERLDRTSVGLVERHPTQR
ncbi:hypothetical protein [Actinomadura fibrosa]|uniref:Secreted protein n=1 Tax=Actinomadura fibrosa TaxID=111802 RepID=A0ABW2XIE9_9ACTN|nr:hypothetical protein [Actinomadura fibrosa]